MKKRIFFMLILAIAGITSMNAQMRISGSEAPNKSAVLDLNPDDQTTQGNAVSGLALPRVRLKNTGDTYPLLSHVPGMTVYNTATAGDVVPGIYFNNGARWIRQMDDESTKLTVEKDSIIGNEVTGVTDGSLALSGAGTTLSPYTLSVAPGGITTDKLADGSITINKFAENTFIELGDNIATNIYNTVLGDTIINYITNNLDSSVFMDSIMNYISHNNEYIEQLINSISANVYYTILGDSIINYITRNFSTTELGDSIAYYISQNFNTTELGDTIMEYITHNLDNSALMDSVANYISNNNSYLRQLIDNIAQNVYNTTLGDSIVNYITRHISTTELGDTIMEYITRNLDSSALMDSVANYIANNNSYLRQLIDNIAQNIYNTTLGESIVKLIYENEMDGIVGNEVTNATTGGGLSRSGSGTAVSPYTLGISIGGVTSSHIADATITNADINASAAIAGSKLADKSIALAKVNASGTASASTYLRGDGTWATPAGDGQGVTSVSGANGITVTNGTTTPVVSLPAGGTSGNVLKWNGTTWATAADAGITTEADSIVGNEVTNATTDGGLTRSGSGTAVAPYTLGITTGGVTNTHLANNAVTTEKISDSVITSAKIADGTIVAADLGQMGATTGQTLKWNGTTWIPSADAGITTEADGIVGNEVTNATTNGGLTRSGSGTGAAPYTLGIATGGVMNTHLANNAVTTEKISDSAVTSAKIAEGTITNADINASAAIALNKIALPDASANKDKVLKSNGTAWVAGVDDDSDTNTTYTAGNGLTLSSTTFSIGTEQINSTMIADNAVTSAKIVNGTISAADLGQMGATAGQTLKWNGTAWIPSADAGITTEADGIVGNEITDATAGGGLARSGSGTAVAPYTLGISTGGVTNVHLADKSVFMSKVNATGTASASTYLRGDGTWTAPVGDGQGVTSVNGANGITVTNGTTTPVVSLPAGGTSGYVLKWNGTTWATASDAGITTEVDGIIGNEVTNATASGGLTRSGSGTAAAPYTLGIATGGVTSSHIADATITNADINATAAIAGTKLADKSVAVGKVNATGTASASTFLRGDGAWAAPAGDGQGVTSVSGANGITVTNGTTTPAVSLPAGGTTGNVLKWNGTTWATAADAGITTEVDGIIGNEVTNATASGGLTRSGSGTAATPYTLGIAAGGVTSSHLADNAVTSAKIADNTITASDIATGAVTTDKILNGTIKAEDLNNMGASNGQILTYNGSVWAPATATLKPTTITDSYTATNSITSSGYNDAYTWTDLQPGLYSLRVRMGGTSTAKFILQSDVAFGTSIQFEVNSISTNYGGDGTAEIMFNYYYTGTLRLKALCTGGCPTRFFNLYLARF
jgi:hypothetical protein